MKTLHLVLAAALAVSASAPAFAHGDMKDMHGSMHGGAAHGGDQHAAGEREQVTTEFGQTGDAKSAARTMQIDMADTMRFTPASITVKQGETVRFVVRNRGQVMHEMVLGTDEALRGHAEMMRKHPGMEHDEPYMTHVAPGKRGEILWQFTQPGEFKFACLIPGHFEAGMVGTIKVVAR
jgi:uncharacterized cupredoxin-like copper-binding protein